MAPSLSMVLKHSAIVILTMQGEPAAKKTQLRLLLPTQMQASDQPNRTGRSYTTL